MAGFATGVGALAPPKAGFTGAADDFAGPDDAPPVAPCNILIRAEQMSVLA